MLDMLRDCNTGIRWVLNHTQQHGGDPSRVFLVGQSCGAQIAALALITQVHLGYPLHCNKLLYLHQCEGA